MVMNNSGKNTSRRRSTRRRDVNASSDARANNSARSRRSSARSFERSAYGSGDTRQASASSRRYAGVNPVVAGSEQARFSRGANSQEYVRLQQLKRKKKRRKKTALIVLLVVLVLALGVAGAAWAYFASIEGSLHENVDDDLLDSLTVSDSPSDPFYMLLIGADKSEARDESGEFGDSYRTDTMILIRVDPKDKKVTMVSIPRDTKVYIEGHGYQKINAAYTFGVQAVQLMRFLSLRA